MEHRKEGNYEGDQVPENLTYYARIAKLMQSAKSILLIGDATGKSSAMLRLSEYLAKAHKATSDRVIATIDADLSALTAAAMPHIALALVEPGMNHFVRAFVSGGGGRGERARPPSDNYLGRLRV